MYCLRDKFCDKFFLQALVQSAQHLYEQRKGFGSESVFVSGPLTNRSGWPKNMRIWIQNPNTEEATKKLNTVDRSSNVTYLDGLIKRRKVRAGGPGS